MAVDVQGTVYLICFDQPFKHARHYMGWASDVHERIEQHAAGQGARLMEVVTDAGITWRVTITWQGSRFLERRLKNRKNAPGLCPRCRYQATGKVDC